MRYERSLAIASRHEKLIELLRRVFVSRTGQKAQSVRADRDVDFLKKRGYSIRSVRLLKGWAYKL